MKKRRRGRFLNPYREWKRRSTSQKKIVLRHGGRTYFNLTRWLPDKIQVSGAWIVVEDDFSILIENLKQSKRRFIIRQNARKQRALFVEE